MRIVISKCVGARWALLALMFAGAAACSVFDPPVGLTDGGGQGGGAAGTGGAAGNNSVDGSSGMGGNSGTADSGGSSGSGGSVGGSDAGADSGDAGPRGDGSTAPFWPYTRPDGCQSAGMPKESDRPASSDPGADLPPFYLAMSQLLVGTTRIETDGGVTQSVPDPNAWKDLGFDMDGVCTQSATCEDQNQVLVKELPCQNLNIVPRDGNQCRDNEIGAIYGLASGTSTIGQYFGFTEDDTNCELYRGGYSVLFKISNYNGQLNDKDVRVDVYTSMGLKSLPNWTCRTTIDSVLDNTYATSHAPWGSFNNWTIASQSLDPAAPDAGADLPNGKAADPAAFVRNGYLVAQMPDGAYLWFDGERTPIPGFRSIMHRGLVVGKLAQDSNTGTWLIEDGTIAYVATPGDIVESFRQMGFCENMCDAYAQVTGYLNASQDALSTTSAILPDTACNGLTAGFAFTARQGTVSPADVHPATEPTDCPQPRSQCAPRQGCSCDMSASTYCALGCTDAGTTDSGAADAGGN